MKRSTLKFFLSMAAVMGVAGSASADLLYTFDTAGGVPSTAAVPEAGGGAAGNYVWDSTFQAIKHNVTGANQGGWTLGGSDNMQFQFNWPAQTVMQAFDNSYAATVSFDLILRDQSWAFANNADAMWLQFNIAGNSGGAQGWTSQSLSGPFAMWQNGTYHYTFTFAQLGWGEGGGTDGWYQLYFGANSDAANGVGFYIDNIDVAPEPTTFALMGLGAAALFVFRRR